LSEGGLRGLAPSWRVLITGFVLVLGAGYLSGALNAALAVGLTPAAIADHYRDRTLSHAEAAEVARQGFVETEVTFGDAPAEEAGHDMDAHEHAEAGGAMEAGTGGGRSITAQQLAQLAHVHLLGFALILISVGSLACLTGLPEALKVAVVLLLAVCLGADIGGLWLVRFVSEGFAWLTAASGVGIGACVALTSLRVLWELWSPAPAGHGGR
jgi:hypothetical protein